MKNFENAIQSLGLSIEEETIDLLIGINNTRIQNLDRKIEETKREH